MRRTLATAATRAHSTTTHVHAASCSHAAHAVAPAATGAAVATPPTAAPAAAAGAGAGSLSASLSRPLPPVLSKGQMPPGDHSRLAGWYQRPLPASLIPFASNRGKQIFKQAMAAGGMEGYFALAEQFQTQSTPSCQTQREENSSGQAARACNHNHSCGCSMLSMVRSFVVLAPI